ncbi:MAG: type II secretion system protein GspE, partial [Acidiphilium sp. 21-66-27]
MLDHAATRPDEESSAIGPALLRAGLVDPIGIARARALAAETGLGLAAALVRLGLIGERSLAEAAAAAAGLALLAPDAYPAAPVLPERLRPRFLRDARVLPLAMDAGVLDLAMVDPFDGFAAGAVAAATGCAVRRA